jgi:hypothetical protein
MKKRQGKNRMKMKMRKIFADEEDTKEEAVPAEENP